jgi:hypothetical protein
MDHFTTMRIMFLQNGAKFARKQYKWIHIFSTNELWQKKQLLQL